MCFGNHFRSGYSHAQSYGYGDAHKCNKPCDCSACCCDKKKDILCDLLQIFLMCVIIQLLISAFILSPVFIPGRRKRRRRSLDDLSSSLKVIPNSDNFEDVRSIIYRLGLAGVTTFLEDDSRIEAIAPYSANKVTYNIAHNREPRNWLFFGDDQNYPPFPDSCQLKCCLKCCKKDRILCIIQVMLLTTIIGQLMIINTLLVICDFFPLILLPPCFPIGIGRRKRSVSMQKPIASLFGYHEQTFTSSEEDIYEVARNIINSLSNIARTRDFAIDLRHASRECQTCIPCRVQTIRPLTDGLVHIGRYIGQ